MTTRGKCLLYLIATAALWSLSGVLIKSIDWNPMAIASSRSLVAAVTLAVLMRRRLTFSRPTWGQGLAGIFLALVMVTFTCATKLTTAANAILLQYTAPVWVAILAPLALHERTRRRDWLFMSVAFVGMGLFFKDSLSSEGFWGNVLALVSGVFFAAMAMTARYIKDDKPAQAMVLGNLLSFALGLWFWGPPWPDAGDLLLILFAGVFQLGLPYYLYTLALSGVTSLELVLITIIEPVLSPVWVFLATGERPGHWALVGGGLVIATVSLWSLSKVRSARGGSSE